MKLCPNRLSLLALFMLVMGGTILTGAHLSAQQIDFGNEPHDSQAAIEITADEFSYDESGTVARFQGNVRMAQDKAILTADRVVIHYDDNRRLKETIATGNVLITRAHQSVKAERAHYNAQENTLSLSGGKVVAVDGNTVISGKTFVIDIGKRTGTMRGNAVILLQPQNAE